jgi:multicomponent Na+:H+ antiporter subunit D
VLHFDDTVADLPLLAVAGPVAFACIILVAGRHLARVVVDAIAIAAAAAVTGLDAFLLVATSNGRSVEWVARWTPVHGRSVGVDFEVDPIGAGLALLVAALVTLALIYSIRYLESEGGHYHALVLLFLAGLQGFSLTGDVFDLFVFLELVSASAYGLTAMQVEDQSALQGGLSFALVNSLGAYFSLMGIGLLYARTGALQMAVLGRLLSHGRPGILVIGAFVMLLIGLFVKSGAAPFHFWVADAHAVAPAPVAFLFSAIMDPLGIYAVLRVYWTVFAGVIPHPVVRTAFLVLGVLTAGLGAMMCAAQRHIKRLLAFSTISHVGLFLCALALLTPAGTAGAAVYVLGHAGVKGALFLLAGILLDRYGSIDELQLFGKGRGAWVIGGLIALCGLGLAGMPPFATGLGKAISENAGLSAGLWWFPLLYVTVSALTGGAVLRVAARVFLGLGDRPAPGNRRAGQEVRPPGRLGDRSVGAWIAIGILLTGAIALGVVPGMHAAVERAAALFVDRHGYIAAAFGASSPAVASAPVGNWTLDGVLLDLASAVLALGVAASALWGRRIWERLPAAPRAGSALFGVLHRLHSGHIGDYVAWMMAGGALLAGLIGLPLR